MLGIQPKSMSLADVYVPYCYMHPERLITRKVNLGVTEDGFTRVETGDKHDLVIGIDYSHFSDYVKNYLK
jgi:hypothetical protein